MLTTQDIQIYTKDKPELNILLEGALQSSGELVEFCIDLAVDGFNAMPPATQFVRKNFPSKSILLYGTLHHLCISEAEKQLRNQVNFNAQGIASQIDDKMPQYNKLSQFYQQLFERSAKPLKQHLNMQNAWGDEFSPYAYLNEHYYRS